MPANIIKAAAKQTGKSASALDKVWTKIKKSVMGSKKYEGYSSDRKFGIVTKVFMRTVGYKPKAEAYVGVFRLSGVDEAKIISFLREKKARDIVVVDVGEGKKSVVCKLSEPYKIDEGYYGLSNSTYFDDQFTSLWSIIYDACGYNLSSDAREKMDGEAWEKRREQAEANVKEATGLGEKRLEEARFMKSQDGDAFHVFWSSSPQNCMNFLYALYEQDKEMAFTLIREGLIFEYHKFITFEKVAV